MVDEKKEAELNQRYFKREYPITEDNKLAQQRYITKKSKGQSPTLTEEKALAYIVSKINPTDKELGPIEYDIKEFCDICGFDERQSYVRVREVLDGLLSRRAWIDRENGDSDGYTYFSHIHASKGSGKGYVEINDKLKSYFINMKGNFYQFPLHDILAMKTARGIQLYKLLKSLYFKNRNIEFDIETLKGYLDCVGKYPEFKVFRKKVLRPALEDINTYSDLQVDLETVKEGKYVKKVIFHTVDLLKNALPEDIDEYNRRHRNVDREIDPDQLVFAEIYDGMGDYPL